MAARGFLGAGDVYIARFDPATNGYLPFKGPYESTKFEIKASTQLREMTGRGKATYGQILASVAIPQPTEFSIEVAEVNRESLALAVLGSVAALTQTAATVTNEMVTAKLGQWVPLSKNTLQAASVVVTNAAGTTTYAEGTDYDVNYALGWVMPRIGGAITDSQQLAVDFSAAAVNGSRIRGVTQPQVRAKVMFDGINLVDGSPCIVDCYEATISSSSAFNFLDDKFNSVPMTGRLATPVGRTEPFEIRLPNG